MHMQKSRTKNGAGAKILFLARDHTSSGALELCRQAGAIVTLADRADAFYGLVHQFDAIVAADKALGASLLAEASANKTPMYVMLGEPITTSQINVLSLGAYRMRRELRAFIESLTFSTALRSANRSVEDMQFGSLLKRKRPKTKSLFRLKGATVE